MSKQVEISEENVVPVTADQLNAEQKAEMESLVEQFQNMYLQTYSRTQQGTLIQKSKVVMPSPGDGAGTSAAAHDYTVKTEDTAAPTLQDRIDSAVHSALVNQSGILVNTLTNTVKSILDGTIHQYKPQGPIFLPENKFPAYRTLRNDLSTAQPTAPMPPPSAQPTTTLPFVLTKQIGGSPQHITEEQYAQWTRGKQSVIELMQQVPINQPSAGQPQAPTFSNPPPQAVYNTPQGYQPYSPRQYQAEGLQQSYQQDLPHRPAGYWADMIAEVMRDQFGLKPKENSTVYRHPYPEEFDRVPLPSRYKIPDFSKFSGQDNVSTYEHVSRFLAQCGEASAIEALRVRFFPLSLSGSAFTWFSSLPCNSIRGWIDLEKQFHRYFYNGVQEMKLSDLTAIRQRVDESVPEYIQRFRDIRNRCYSLSLTDSQLADLAFQGLLGPIRERFSSQEFESLAQLAQRVSAHEQRFQEAKKFAKKINTVYQYASDDEDEEDVDVDLAEWARMRKPTTCQWVKKGDKEDKFDFDVNKADKIFDLLLQEKQIQLPVGHVLPSAEEIKKRRYCKQQIQSAIEQGRIKIDDAKRPMKIEGHPFPVNMVRADRADGGAHRTGKRPYQTSEGLIRKYQRRQEEQAQDHVDQDNSYDPHWECEFFRFCWNEGMRLPSIQECSACNGAEDYYKGSSSRQVHRPAKQRKSVHERLGSMHQDQQTEAEEQVQNPQWCPSDVFTKTQKRRVQRLRRKEQIQEQQVTITHRPAKTRKEWRIKSTVVTADEGTSDTARASAASKGKRVASVPVNMVFILPAEYSVQAADEAVADDEQSSARLQLSPDQAIFDKPVDDSYRHLRPLCIKGFINGRPMTKMLVDGGAAVNLMPYTTFRKLGKVPEHLIKTNMVLKDFGGNASEAKGVLNVELTVGSKTIPTTFFVFDGKGSYSLLLGRDWIHANCCVPSTMHQCLMQWQGDQVEIVQADRRLKIKTSSYFSKDVSSAVKDEQASPYTNDAVDGLDGKLGQGFTSADELEVVDIGIGDRSRPTYVSANLSKKYKIDLINLLKEFMDCFAWEYHEMPGLSRSIVEHRLPMKPGYRPFKQAPRRFKADMHEAIKAEITRLYDANFIRPCRYAEWVSNIVPVMKKNDKLRVCIDFRDLNKATPKDEYPMPQADLLVDAASGHKIISFMDGNAGYNQIFMAEEDVHKTAFRCPGAIGLYEWVVITFGLKNAGATYQRAMNYIFHDLIGSLIEVYIDDVVVKSREYDMHLADLRKVLERAKKYGLKMNPNKCAFGVSAGQFLGFLVHERGIEIRQKNIDAIKNIKPPTNKTKLQSLLGKVNFVRRFISNLSGRIEPFTPLLKIKEDEEFIWGDKQQKALDDIKEYLSSPPVLIPPQKGVPFRLYLSADEKSIGSVLVQEIDSKERVILYLSRRLLDAETRHGCGIGLVIISPRGASFEFAFTIKPYYTNNQTEYEAVFKGLQLLRKVEADSVEIIGDSQLVINQLSGAYECKNDILRVYNEECKELLQGFKIVTMRHIPRKQNFEANDLAQGASGYRPMAKDIQIQIVLVHADDWRFDIIEYLRNPSQSASRRMKYKVLHYVLLDDDLYYRTIDGVLLKCLGPEEAKIVMSEVHEGICGTHQSAQKMRWLLKRVGYFWPTMLEDCFKYYKGCQDCQKFGAIQRAPASAMHPIIKPWPFRGWGIDMIGQINPPSSKGHKYILVATDYFTKWVETVPLKKVDSKDAIQFVKEYIIYRFGLPQTITTDQGSIFVSDEFVQFADSMDIKLLNSSPYYAQANGQAEASNKTLIKLIKRKINEQPRQWHTTLADSLWAYRMACHGAIQVPPYQLVYGHEVVLPWETNIGSRRIALQDDLTADEYHNLMADELDDLAHIRLRALEKIKRDKDRVARHYNKKVVAKSFEEGDLVWKLIMPIGSRDNKFGKWSLNWEGPFQIHRCVPHNAYLLKGLDGEIYGRALNGKYLKRYYPSVWIDS
uniref:OO_Ba0005L10-OO_Ba0081K17.19 protein n=1 Tax=Oryza officinalis TaxID=4535 RepID=D0ABC3_9ORYZ|nr:OO_Ba0005L10-OO_Ba0081K17.19 [Oryza officinalis]